MKKINIRVKGAIISIVAFTSLLSGCGDFKLQHDGLTDNEIYMEDNNDSLEDDNNGLEDNNDSLNDDYNELDELKNLLETDKICKENPLKGIDVSYCQGDIDWSVTKDHIDFAILRVGDAANKTETGEYELDAKFIQNIEQCQYYGIDVGVYFFSRATNLDEACAEASFVLNAIKKYDLTFPIFIDVECNAHIEMVQNNPKQLEGIIDTWLLTIRNAGYCSGIYSSASNFRNMSYAGLDIDEYDKWIANFGMNDEKKFEDMCDFDFEYNGEYKMHQAGDRNIIPGINGYVDGNFCYFDYPDVMTIIR